MKGGDDTGEEQGGWVNRCSKKTKADESSRGRKEGIVCCFRCPRGGGSEGVEDQLQWVD